MKDNCQFITTKFYRYDCIPYGHTDCYRIITNEGVYFFYKNQFIDVTVLDKLHVYLAFRWFYYIPYLQH